MTARFEEQFRVVVTDSGITCEHPSRGSQQIGWDEIEEIDIVTTDQGPWLPDVWLVLLGNTNRCLVPQIAVGYDALYERVSKLEGFDYDAVIAAMATTENAKFICWKRKDHQ